MKDALEPHGLMRFGAMRRGQVLSVTPVSRSLSVHSRSACAGSIAQGRTPPSNTSPSATTRAISQFSQ